MGTVLFLFPGRTDSLFSWTIKPPLTAAFLGAAYWASFFIEFLSARERTWARARIAVPAVVLFTWITLVVTLIHLDKFHFDRDPGSFTLWITWVWLLVYAIVPVIITWLLVLQLRTPGGEPDRGSFMPHWLRLTLGAQATVMLLLGIALLVAPLLVGPAVWPWALSALTGRAIGAWLFGLGIAAAQMAWERDLRRVQGGMATYVAFGVLQVIVLARFMTVRNAESGVAVLDWSNPQAWVYLGFMISLAIVGLYGWIASRKEVSSFNPG